MNNLWTLIIAALIGLGLALSGVGQTNAPAVGQPPEAQESIIIHPFMPENIEKTDDGYLIRDNGTEEVYLFDEDTLLQPETEGDIPGYVEGEPPLQWLERYLNEPIDSGLGFGMGDLFDIIETDHHIDVLRGVYWWD